MTSARTRTREARARIVTRTIHELVLGTGYSSTVLVAGALHVQLHMDDVIGLFVDDVMMLAYNYVWVQIITQYTRTVRVNETMKVSCHTYQ